MTNINYDPTNANGASGGFGPANQTVFTQEQGFITKVFNWMFLGLLSSGVVAFLVATNEVIMRAIYSNVVILIVLGIGTLALVWNLSANILKMSPQAAATNFFVYSALNGVLLSSVFAVYTASSIANTFFVAAGTFGAMALYGATTKKDLSKMGNLLFMALIGLIIAQIVNMFFVNPGFTSIINYLGVLIFVGLTAYDMQKIKEIGNRASYQPSLAIFGALSLYLDFINLFLFLLRIFGHKKE